MRDVRKSRAENLKTACNVHYVHNTSDPLKDSNVVNARAFKHTHIRAPPGNCGAGEERKGEREGRREGGKRRTKSVSRIISLVLRR